jgi:hypothetical protein
MASYQDFKSEINTLDAFAKNGKMTLDAFASGGNMGGRNELDKNRQSIGTLILNQNHSIDRSLEELDNLQY